MHICVYTILLIHTYKAVQYRHLYYITPNFHDQVFASLAIITKREFFLTAAQSTGFDNSKSL